MSDTIDVFDYIAFAVFALLFVAALVPIVIIVKLPRQIARKRGDPQADAITAAGCLHFEDEDGLAVGWPRPFLPPPITA